MLKEKIEPSYYKQGNSSCMDLIEQKLGITGAIDFCEGNCIKYEFRAGKKEGNSAEQDLAKAEWYRNKAAELGLKLMENGLTNN